MRLKSFAERLLHGSGAMHVVRARQRSHCRILMYHGFRGGPEAVRTHLTRQCEHLRRYYRPVSLSEIAEALRTNTPLPPNALTITVDDGYSDLKLAFPIFRSFGFSVTVYIVSDFSDGRLWLWPDQVKYAFRNTSLREVSVALEPGRVRQFSVNTEGNEELERVMMLLPNQERLRVLGSLPERFSVDIPASPPPACEPLSWHDIRTMAAEGLEIGAHTRSHPILSRVESPDELADEISGCKRRIEEELRSPVRHFCYPNGRREDYGLAAMQAVREAGYETAVTTEPGLVKRGADPFQLNRLGVEPYDRPLYFERVIA
ncbi:MAG: polysaccharide deacetylase, partial [Bryobacterales bacterium]|nr:polysaccharide deacetylase [Bryobacterales bacterium]